MAKTKEAKVIRYYIRWDEAAYHRALDRGITHQQYMNRAYRWYCNFLEISPKDKKINEMTPYERRLQEWKLWKYVKCITRAKTWAGYERKIGQLAKIVGEDKLIIDEKPAPVYVS